MFAEHIAQGSVQQMRSSVIAHRRVPLVRIDARVQSKLLHHRRDGMNPVDVQSFYGSVCPNDIRELIAFFVIEGALVPNWPPASA